MTLAEMLKRAAPDSGLMAEEVSTGGSGVAVWIGRERDARFYCLVTDSWDRLPVAGSHVFLGWYDREAGTQEITYVEWVEADDLSVEEMCSRIMVAIAVEQVKTEILEDIASGRVPNTVSDFSQLHDYLDANEYGGMTEQRASWSTEQWVQVQDLVHEWLQRRAESLAMGRIVAQRFPDQST